MSRKARDLDLDEDLAFQKKEWLAQRVGIGILFALVVGAALGLTGMGGPLSHGEAGQRQDPVFVEFDRVVRRGATATIRLHLRGAPGETRFWVSAPYLEQVRVENVVPPPRHLAVDEKRHVYTIQSESSEVTIRLDVEHQTIGRMDATIGLVDGPSVHFTQLSLF